MSDAQAAHVTENGVPPSTQDALVEEAPGFKVLLSDPRPLFLTPPSQVFAGNLAYSTTDEGLKTFFAPVQSDMYFHFPLASTPPRSSSPASQYRSSCAVLAPQVMASSPCPTQRLPKRQSSPSTDRNSMAETSSSRLPSQPNKRTRKIRRKRPRDVQADAVPRLSPAKSPTPKPMATSKRTTLLLLPVPTKQPSPRRRRRRPPYVFLYSTLLVFLISLYLAQAKARA